MPLWAVDLDYHPVSTYLPLQNSFFPDLQSDALGFDDSLFFCLQILDGQVSRYFMEKAFNSKSDAWVGVLS